jgi:hypothetical protein
MDEVGIASSFGSSGPRCGRAWACGETRGARNRTTLAAETLLDGEAENITRKAVQSALEGNSIALRICMAGRAASVDPCSSGEAARARAHIRGGRFTRPAGGAGGRSLFA